MQEITVSSPSTQEPLWRDAAWCRALTLAERLASLHAQRATQALTNTQHIQSDERARQRLQRWKDERLFRAGVDFTERLAADQMSEDDLLTLLGEPMEEVQARTPQPEWLTELEQVLQTMEGPAIADLLGTPTNNTASSNIDILNTILPFIVYGLQQLHTGVDALSTRYATLPFEPQMLSQIFLPNLLTTVSFQVSRTMALELNVARLQGHLQGDTPEARFHSFIKLLSQKEHFLPILEEYAVMTRQLLLTVRNWVRYSLEVLDHMCADWEELLRLFSPDADPGMLIEAQGGAGDSHRGGRSVIKLRFASGLRLVYKPKSLAIDVHFQQLLTWLNEHGAQPALRTTQLLHRGEYGWSEFIEAPSCNSRAEVSRFYERLGGYLALLYTLDATDFHFENLIASGEHPMLVDLEALFHPHVDGIAIGGTDQIALRELHFSVMRVGLLPNRIFQNGAEEGIDISGLGGREGQKSPRPVPRWQDAGTDQMRLVREHLLIPGQDNRPRLNGLDVELLDYGQAILDGFTHMYRLLIHHRDTFSAGPLQWFAHDEIRVIVRPTSYYGRMLIESFHPDLLRDALDRDRYFDYLWVATKQQAYLAKLLSFERKDLQDGDIPIFTTHPDTRDLLTSRNECLPTFFDEPSLEVARRLLYSLDEHDLKRQRWFIQASLASVLLGVSPGMWRSGSIKELPAQGATRDELVKAACKIGDHLCELAIRQGERTDWIGLSLVGERQWMVAPVMPDLYNGSAGIILFLAYLGAVTGNTRYTEMARAGLASIDYQVEQVKENIGSIGAFEGWGSLVYLYAHLGTLWQEPDLFKKAEMPIERIAAFVEQDEVYDIIGGSAGAILTLAALYHASPSTNTLEIARRCGERLLATATPQEQGIGWSSPMALGKPLAGFSHGCAGFAYSLLLLADLTGEPRFSEAAQATIEHERSLFSQEMQEWPDLRDYETLGRVNASAEQGEPVFMTAWCHGSPGIGMARLASLRYLDTTTMRAEIEITLKHIEDAGFSNNHSLCHGALGNLETLLLAAQVLNDTAYEQRVRQYSAQILKSIEVDGWLTGIPMGVESPGLMTGLAGIGYELLRLAEPQQIPSVLVLAPPTAFPARESN